MRICSECGENNPNNFYYSIKRKKLDKGALCKKCTNKRKSEIQMVKYHNNPEFKKHHLEMSGKRNKARYRKYKELVFNHYAVDGQIKCSLCGMANPTCLSIDHINGGGSKHLRKIKIVLYIWLIKNNFPEGSRILCMNCQFIERERIGAYEEVN